MVAAPRSLIPKAQQDRLAVPPADPSLERAAEAPALVPIFPLEDAGTGLVLYEGPPGELRIHWRLARDDFERAAASFPVNGRRPAAVVRLRRDRPEGGTDQVEEIPLGLGVREGRGEQGVRIPTDHRRYHAELGLTNALGGWLMLARSNGLYNAQGIGVDVEGMALAREASSHGRGAASAVSAPTIASTTVLPAASALSGGLPVEPALGDRPPPLGAQDFPLVAWEPSPLTARVSPGGAAEPEPRVPGGPVGFGPRRPEASVPAGRGQADQPEGLVAGGLTPSLGEGLAGPPGAIAPRIVAAIEPLTYESPPTLVNGLELEAELRILGRARPGSSVDLFGFQYQVGPGGRFQLVLPVTDPQILRRALEAAPPPELIQHRGD